MQRIQQSAVSIAANLLYWASNVTGATWTLTTFITTDGLGHLVTIRNDAVTDHSAKTALITGSYNGKVVTETVALPGPSATITSTKYFDTLVSVVPSASIGADTMDIGISATSVTPWIVFQQEALKSGFNLGFSCTITGTVAYGVEFSYDTLSVYNHATVAAQTANAAGSILFPVGAIRMKMTAASTVDLVGYLW